MDLLQDEARASNKHIIYISDLLKKLFNFLLHQMSIERVEGWRSSKQNLLKKMKAFDKTSSSTMSLIFR